MKLRTLLTSAVVAVIAFALLWAKYGHYFFLSIDEGIYLEGAIRVARGQQPYRDFFTVTGPATYWLYGTLFHFFGETLAVARAMLCVELALLCAVINWLVSQVSKPGFAASFALLYAALLVTSPYPLYVTHRWDSNALALLAVAFAWSSRRQPKYAIASGACAAAAALFTPPAAILIVALALWTRRAIWFYAAGSAIPLLFAIRTLPGMAKSLLWDASNYANANRVGYGALTGDLTLSFPPQLTGLRYAQAVVKYAEAMLPAVLPVFAAIAIIALLRRSNRDFGILLAISSIAILAAVFPRFGGAQLWFPSAIFWVAASAGAYALLPALGRLAVPAAFAILLLMRSTEPMKTLDTHAGNVTLSRLHFVVTSGILESVKPADSLFVFPYLPILYFATGGVNPTRYSYLQPGMMGPDDEKSVMADLQAHPPKWVIRHTFSEAFIQKNWPASDKTRMRFPAIEKFLDENYIVTNPDEVGVGYRLLQHVSNLRE